MFWVGVIVGISVGTVIGFMLCSVFGRWDEEDKYGEWS